MLSINFIITSVLIWHHSYHFTRSLDITCHNLTMPLFPFRDSISQLCTVLLSCVSLHSWWGLQLNDRQIIIKENYKQIRLRYESEVLRAGMWNVHREWTVIDTGWRLIYTSEEIREHGSVYLTTVETIICEGKGNSTLRHHFVTFYFTRVFLPAVKESLLSH